MSRIRDCRAAKLAAFAALEIDNNLKSYVQQRGPGAIFRRELCRPGIGSRRNAHGNN